MGGRRITQEEFVRRARAAHGDLYDYSQAVFEKSNKHVTIICRKHGPFQQRAYDHLLGHGCPRCGGDRAMEWKRSSREEFAERAREVHGDKYDYSQVEYTNADTPVKIICPVHGPFMQTPYTHLSGCGCRDCGYEKANKDKRMGGDEFLRRARTLHGDRYDYSQAEYAGYEVPTTIICAKHGPFLQSPHSHLAGCGCPKCGREVCADKLRNSKEDFLQKARAVHGDKYDYSLVEYVDERRHVKIVCPTHGVFTQSPTHHLQGHGCRECFSDQLKHVMQNRLRHVQPPPRKTTEQFIADAQRVHGDLYDYSRTEYIRDDEKVTIVCRKHGPFQQKANNHLNGAGCPVCRASKGELRVRKWLEQSGRHFRKEAVLRSPLAPGKRHFFKVDFLVDGKRPVIIEYNGVQHYARIEQWERAGGYDYRVLRDIRLREYCEQQGIRLVTIPYTDFDRIEEILNREFQAVV